MWIRVTRAMTLVGVALACAAWLLWPRTPSIDELRALVRQANWPRAKSGLERYVHKHRDAEDAWLLLADVYSQSGQKAAAIDALTRIGTDSPRRVEALYRQGELLWDTGYASRAEDCWRQALDRAQHATRDAATTYSDQPPAPSLWFLWALGRLADLYVIENRTAAARESLWQLFHAFKKEDAAHVDFLFRLTVFDVQAYDPQRAVDVLERCAEVDPDDLEVRCALALYYLRLGKVIRSREIVERLAADRPDDPRVRHANLEYLVTTGDRAGLRSALAHGPTEVQTALTWKYRGIDHENHDELEDAIACYRNAAHLDPRDYQSEARLAQALRLAGKLEEYKELTTRVARTGRYLSELSHYASKLPTDLGNRVTLKQCVDLAQLCSALEWHEEAAAWTEVAALRQSPPRANAPHAHLEPQAALSKVGGASE